DWYWVAPLLADLATEGVLDPVELFDADHLWARHWTGGEADDDEGGARSGEASSTFEEHLNEAYARIEQLRDGEMPLGRVPNDLIEVASLLALGAPGVCALRALARARGAEGLRDPAAIGAAANASWAFRSLFNLPEVTALVRGSHPEDAYWRAVLDYAVAGNLQAVLDEYVHILPDRLGILDPSSPEATDQLADALRDSLKVRTVSYSCHDVADDGDGVHFHQGRHRLRGRFALRFGQDRVEETGDATRTTQVRDAFNSPFWPFVLATTSVGQEGLDFHCYCHSCVHWNLPANPVDLEQREGRVHRYKGHAVRKNVAAQHRAAAFFDGGDPWEALFDAAVAG
ncbi:MAG: helicase, partial [Actinobacteria bacterium]|nr:helicase [Actinomycetota bacterium]